MDYTHGLDPEVMNSKGVSKNFLLLLSGVLQSAVFKDSSNILKIVIFSACDQLLQL